MSLSTRVTNFAAEYLNRYRLQVQEGMARNLRNIYLSNVKAYITKTKVKNAKQMELDPDETFMRLCEERIDIGENSVDGFRRTIWCAWCDGGNTGFLDDRLGPVFVSMARYYQAINKALMVYPNDLDLSPT